MYVGCGTQVLGGNHLCLEDLVGINLTVMGKPAWPPTVKFNTFIFSKCATHVEINMELDWCLDVESVGIGCLYEEEQA